MIWHARERWKGEHESCQASTTMSQTNKRHPAERHSGATHRRTTVAMTLMALARLPRSGDQENADGPDSPCWRPARRRVRLTGSMRTSRRPAQTRPPIVHLPPTVAEVEKQSPETGIPRSRTRSNAGTPYRERRSSAVQGNLRSRRRMGMPTKKHHCGPVHGEEAVIMSAGDTTC